MKRLLLFIVLFSWACSLVIEPGEDRCTDSAGCPMGLSCVDDVCQISPMCVEAPEACNNADDDCDGRVDEDLGEIPEACNGADDDCDGEIDEGFDAVVEVCNGVDDDCDGESDEDVPVRLDVCNGADDDCDGVTDEGTAELCNNRDDDCDGKTDEQSPEGPALCQVGSICNGLCETPDCANDVSLACEGDEICTGDPRECGPPPLDRCTNDSECDSGEICVEGFGPSGLCFEATPLGAPCTSDVSCVAGTFCAELEAVGLTGKTCTNTCCNDSDCADGAVCANGFRGARLCVPAAQAATGLNGRCEAHTDCASGYCRLFAEECQPVCSTDENCASDEACVFDLTDPSLEFTTGCLSAGSRSAAGAFCVRDLDCRSLLCNQNTCIAPCGAAGECDAGQGCTSVSASSGQFVNVCLRENPDGRAGTDCTSNNDCDSLRCYEGTCVAPCCSSAQCDNGDDCQPIHVGDQWPTFCLNP